MTPDETVQSPPASPPIGVLETLISQIEEIVQTARSMPLSASAIVNRQDMIELIETLKRSLPQELSRARDVIGDAQEVIEHARRQSEVMIEQAKAERDRLVQKTEVIEAATRQAERLVSSAENHARKIRREAEAYVEGKLATFEIVLSKTLNQVEKGRARLEGRREADDLAPEDLIDES